MADILGYARVSTGHQDVAGQTLRLIEHGAIKMALLQIISQAEDGLFPTKFMLFRCTPCAKTRPNYSNMAAASWEKCV